MEQHRWLSLMQRLGIEANLDTWQSLVEAYNEEHRYYHTAEHIKAVLRHFDAVKDACLKPQEMELALWFHDAIYQPFSSSNEYDSAQWARKFLEHNLVSEKSIQYVDELIMSTCHNAQGPDSDKWISGSKRVNNEKTLIVDIDLSILGVNENCYRQFEANVRKEYSKVPDFIFKRKRRALLRSFLQSEPIYANDFFFQKLETQARKNLQNAIDLLS